MVRNTFSRPNLLVGAGTLVIVALGVVVNVWTDSWSWIAFAVLLGLTGSVIGLALVIGSSMRSHRMTVTQSASLGGRISDVSVRAGHGSEVEEAATNDGIPADDDRRGQRDDSALE
ncbi:hypothetical protein ACWEOS_15775 [Micromonospora taraxaci]